MARAGEVRVNLTRSAASAASHWLLMVHMPFYLSWPHLLGYARRDHVIRLTQLADYFEKAGRSKRQGEFTAVISRDSVAEFVVATRQPSQSMSVAPPGVWKLAVNMRKAAASRKGRKALSVSTVEDRAHGRFHVSERMRQYAQQRKRNSDTLMKFIRDGGSLLASSVPLPRKTP